MAIAQRPVGLGSGRASLSWKINREIVVVLGWPAAILMQLAHPLVLAGVMDHSVFVAEPRRRFERLHSTIESMLLLTFGTPEDVQRTADKINGIHDYVQGQLVRPAGAFQAGTAYSAHDPELLRWVHATLVDVIPRAYELFVGPLTDDEKDAYLSEATTIAPLLGMPDDFLPSNRAELAAYLERMYASGQIAITDDARGMAGEVLAPPPPLPALSPLRWLNSLPTIALLPPDLRDAYGLRWTPARRATIRAATTLNRRLLPLMPSLVHHWPASRRG